MADPSPSDLHGLVDMGSNGIRFSITNLTAQTARSLPVLFQERSGISLYDAQYSSGERGPISQTVIDQVLTALKRFKITCADFDVPEQNIKILATEATRTAINSEDYRKQIKDATGWEVNMLAKEVEGRVGAMGIASSFENVNGLVMDLGGGSTQLTWMIYENGTVTTSPKGSVSFPYGAAAMTRLLSEIDAEKHSKQARSDLSTKIKQQYIDALASLELPETIQQRAKTHGLTLYLSGGGFRGWGYILMSRAKKGPYPIPIINGYQAHVRDFGDISAMEEAAKNGDIFRVSKRRKGQVPAVALLVSAVTDAFPFITDVRFCQGGVREGYLFQDLPQSIKTQSPLSSATSRYAVDATTSAHLADLLANAIPANGEDLGRWHPSTLTPALLRAIADTMYAQSNVPKESASLSAMYLPITGVLAAAHGISHTDRALLALTLCQRRDGEVPPPHDEFRTRLQCLLTQQEAWWASYLGTVAALLGDIFPSGRVKQSEIGKRIAIESRWADGLGKKGNLQGIRLKVKIRKGDVMARELLMEHVDAIEHMGKKKSRVGGKEYGFGLAINVDISWVE